MKDKKIKKIPYGVANYERVVQKNCCYVDKTMYLRTIKKTNLIKILLIFSGHQLIDMADVI